MAPRPQSKRVRAEDSDSDSQYDDQVANQARENDMARLMEMDLGTYRAGKLKEDDRRQRHEDRANVKHLLDSRDACQKGTEAHALYNKNKKATNAWNSKSFHLYYFSLLINSQIQTTSSTTMKKILMPSMVGMLIDSACAINMAVGWKSQTSGKLAVVKVVATKAVDVLLPGVVEEAWHLLELLYRLVHVLASLLAQAHTLLDRKLSPIHHDLTNICRTTTEPADYRVLDPALQETNDPRSRYGKGPTRGGAPIGRGGGNADRSAGRPILTPSAPARARPIDPRQKHINMLANPTAFMRAVDQMKIKAKAKDEKEAATTVKTTKASSTRIDSKKADAGSVNSPPKPSTSAATPPATSISTANIRQVPTHEFAFPPPHRGETDSWTDGLLSNRSSDYISPSFSCTNEPSPAVGQGGLIGLGIQGVDTSMSDATNKDNTPDGVDLMDVTEDLTVLQEPPKPRAPLAKRILVNDHWYTLDESALGNASSNEVVEASPTPPPEPTPPQGEWNSPHNNTDQDVKPKKATSTKTTSQDVKPTKAASTTTGSSAIFGNCNVNVGAQTTPSLTNSSWNPFVGGTAPGRGNVPHAPAGEFTSFVGDRLEVPAFLETELTSPGGAESIASTPNVTSSIWDRAGAKVATSSQASSSTSAARATSRTVDGGTTTNTDRAPRPNVIDPYELVRLQGVGDASFGMTPFLLTPVAFGESIPRATARPIHARQQSTATSINSDATASSGRGRGLTASRYASGDSASSEHLSLGALQGLSLNSSTSRGGTAVTKPPRSTFGTASNVSRYTMQHDENTPPCPATSTSIPGGRPILRPATRVPRTSITSPARGRGYIPIRTTRSPAVAGLDIMQADIAAAEAAARATNVTVPPSTGGLFPSSTSTSRKATVYDDGYESEL